MRRDAAARQHALHHRGVAPARRVDQDAQLHQAALAASASPSSGSSPRYDGTPVSTPSKSVSACADLDAVGAQAELADGQLVRGWCGS